MLLLHTNCDESFFFKQKTAYEMLRSLVGSEMCIRDSFDVVDRIGRLDIQGNRLSRQSFDENLHTTAQAQDQVERRPVSYTHLTLPTTPYV